MNAPANITRDYLAEAKRISSASMIYVYELGRSDGDYTPRVMRAYRDLLEALNAHIDDGDCRKALENVSEELGLDEDGYPLGSREGPSLSSEWPGNAVMGAFR